MIILVAILFGILAGVLTRMRYLQGGLADTVRPQLRNIMEQLQHIEDGLKRIETELALAHTTYLAEMAQLYRTRLETPGKSEDA